MLRHYGNTFKIGVLIHIGRKIKAIVDKLFRGSLAIREVDASSCNGCELEIHVLNNVYYNIERFGVHFVASPRNTNILFAQD